MSIKKLITLSLAASISLSFIACGSGGTTPKVPDTPTKSSTIKINEILASNKKSIQDPDFNKYADYIELYNSSDSPIDLSGYGLADKDGADVWKFPDGTTIDAKSYLLVWADKKDTGVHTNFKLSSSGESVILFDKTGEVIDRIDFPAQEEDLALTRDGNNNLIYIKPTPNQPNDIDKNKQNPPVDDTFNKNLSNVYISEFMASNKETKMDNDFYKFSDWIELYNQSGSDIDIGNYKLIDMDSDSNWTIPSGTTIPAKSYMIIWADDMYGKAREDGKPIEELHTNFKLSDKKESISLYDANGNLIDKVNFRDQKSDISYGRDDNNYTWGYMKPTFKGKNGSIYEKNDRAKKPSIVLENGKIEITSEDGGTIYYTTDGTTPTKSSTKYQGKIDFNGEIAVIKSREYKDGYIPSKVDTETFLNLDTTLPIVSLSIDSKYLYDDYIGIYVDGKNGIAGLNCYSHKDDGPEDYKNFNRDWERPVYIEYFDKDKNKVFDKSADISIAGQCSRYIKKKSFSFELDKKLKEAIYPMKPDVKKIYDFKLRSGQGGYELGDILSVAVAKSGNLDIDYQAYRVVRVFLNGEYWGVYNIREKKGKDFFKSNYPDIDTDKLDIIAHTMSQDIAKHGTKDEFNKLYNFVTDNNLSTDENYNKIFTMIDKNNFLDYMVFMIFNANRDWVNNNTRMWRENKEGAKWRWMLDDIDNGFRDEYADVDFFKFVTDSSTFLGYLFKDLLKNNTFKSELKDRFNQHLDSTFSESNINNLIDELIDQRIGYMDLERGKWDIGSSLLESYRDTVKGFTNKRVSVIRGQLNSL